jgi:putative endonuclease
MKKETTRSGQAERVRQRRARRMELEARGEDAAAAYLERRGLRIEDRHWSCRSGQIDIVAWDGEDLALVDVTTNRGERAEHRPVSEARKHRLERLARAWLADHEAYARSVRYDLVIINVLSDNRALLRHFRDEFTIPVNR